MANLQTGFQDWIPVAGVVPDLQYFDNSRVSLLAAISLIDIALHDIKGKALKVPEIELLGGMQKKFYSNFCQTSAPPGPEMIENKATHLMKSWLEGNASFTLKPPNQRSV